MEVWASSQTLQDKVLTPLLSFVFLLGALLILLTLRTFHNHNQSLEDLPQSRTNSEGSECVLSVWVCLCCVLLPLCTIDASVSSSDPHLLLLKCNSLPFYLTTHLFIHAASLSSSRPSLQLDDECPPHRRSFQFTPHPHETRRSSLQIARTPSSLPQLSFHHKKA